MIQIFCCPALVGAEILPAALNWHDRFAPDIQESESSMPQQWEDLISDFQTAIEEDRKRFKREWDETLAHFHNAFADIPEEEVIRDFEDALAEVRRERREHQ